MTIGVASTCAAYKCNGKDELDWLTHAEAFRERRPDVEFFCSVQIGQGRDEAFNPLLNRLAELDATIWSFSLNENRSQIDNNMRIRGIVTGRNLAHEWANTRKDIEAILFLDTDVTPTPGGLERLLEVNWPIVGANVPQYCLSGPPVTARQGIFPEPLGVGNESQPGNPEWWVVSGNGCWGQFDQPFPMGAEIQQHMNTAGALLVRRQLLQRLRWRWDLDAGMTDDPCFHADATDLGYPTWVRHDVNFQHPILVPLEDRGHNLNIVA